APRLPARRQRLLVGGVHVGHVEIGADPRRWVFGVGVGEHQHGVSHAYFGMADLSARSGKAIYLVAAERLLEKVDEVGRALDDEVRRERVVALGDWLDRHGASLSGRGVVLSQPARGGVERPFVLSISFPGFPLS